MKLSAQSVAFTVVFAADFRCVDASAGNHR